MTVHEAPVVCKAEIEDKVKGIFAEVLGESKENLKADENFREEYGADSLDALEIAVETEKIFAINISDSEMEEIDTINKMVDVVARKKEENGFNVLKD